ncbi:MAG: hypothetical protein H7836_14065 [Magnetococcus sp. YQC-3]
MDKIYLTIKGTKFVSVLPNDEKTLEAIELLKEISIEYKTITRRTAINKIKKENYKVLVLQNELP